MILFPYRFEKYEDEFIFVEDGGLSFCSGEDFAQRLFSGNLSIEDEQKLVTLGFASWTDSGFYYFLMLRRVVFCLIYRGKLSYFIVIPTLRCDLACTYCQVSRADEHAVGYDMSDAHVEKFIDLLLLHGRSQSIKVEFQGGEPFLRVDIMTKIMAACENAGVTAEFIICSNLNNLPD